MCTAMFPAQSNDEHRTQGHSYKWTSPFKSSSMPDTTHRLSVREINIEDRWA